MTVSYKEYKNPYGSGISYVRSDGLAIPADHANTDYQAYLLWLEEGNTPMSADADGEPADE